MIEATCSACGTVNRIAEADVPLGAKFVTCTSCKSRVSLPANVQARVPTTKVPLIPAPAIPKIPSPAMPAREPKDLADLPAPKRQGPLAGMEASKPAPRSGLDHADLTDLPAPKTIPVGLSDLPAPKGRAMTPPKASPVAKPYAGISDLPAPKPRGGIGDLPAPRPRAATPPSALPTVRPVIPAAIPAVKSELDIVDLPAPKDISDLPAPKPNAGIDLPAPKGFFDDLPQPAKATKQGTTDLPAPKGFFDDLPQPAKASTPAASDLLAPKGFFDDLPQPSKSSAPGLPAPKGFFDDLPQPSKQPTVPPPIKAAAPVPAPRPPAPPSGGGGGGGIFDDLPEPSNDALGDLDLGPSTGPALELDAGSGDDPAELDLGLATPSDSPAKGGDFADLDLSSPTALPPPQIKTGISIKSSAPKPPASPNSSAAMELSPSKAELTLTLEDEASRPEAVGLATPARRDAAKKKAAEDSYEQKQKRAKRRKILLGVLLGVALAGSGGAYLYKRYADKQAREAEVAEHVKLSRAQIHEAGPNHWTRAATEAGAALELEPKNIDAIALQAEALLGGALDTGLGGDARIAAGKKKLADALERNVTGPQLEGAQALSMIAQNQPDRAIQKLQQMTQREPKNGFWLLYLGWAQVAKGDPASAIKAFDAALAADPKVKLPVLYARGKAKLALVDLAGAKADFAAVLELDKGHIGAQVGLAATLPASQASQREADLLAILARKDIGAGDPRAVIQAWTLAGEAARMGNRLDVARDRYHKALELSKLDVPALVGLARVELRDGKLAVAQDLAQKALAQAPENPDAQLVTADLDIRQGKLPDAVAITQKLAARQPPLPASQAAQLQLVTGNLLESQGRDDDAIDAWVEGAKLAGDTDLAPMMAAVTKLGGLAKKASDNKDDKKAADYRTRADQLLSSLADRAQEDSALAKALGVAYLGADDAAKAEHFLRRAVEMKGDDIDTRLELARALSKLGRTDDALEQLKAAQQLDATRADIALEIARTYEDAKRDDEALAAYLKLIAAKDPPVQARVRAGRFLARKGDIKNAASQAAPILAAEPSNPAGHYLKGEGLIASNHLDDARKELTLAVDGDPDAQYLDALGRATEGLGKSEDKYNETALRAYERAIAIAPTLFNPQAGTGRIYVHRKEWSKAIAPLTAANKLDPNDADVMLNMGFALRMQGNSAQAATWLQSAVKRKADADAYWELSQIYLDSNNGGAAENALREATHLGSEKETKEGVKIDWLTDAFYSLGQTEQLMHNNGAAKAAYEKFLSRNPTNQVRVTEARHQLTTELRNP